MFIGWCSVDCEFEVECSVGALTCDECSVVHRSVESDIAPSLELLRSHLMIM